MLETLFRDSPIIKVLDFFLQHQDYDYSKNEIMKYCNISRATLYSEKVWGTIEKLELLEETRQIGKATLYKLNIKNPIVKKLDQLDNEISGYINEMLARKELMEEERKAERVEGKV
jgi:predicted DNA-binding protein YlxM (UPF0122 family)